jgi:hypothetical protein
MAQLLGHLSKELINIKFMRDYARYDDLKYKFTAYKIRTEIRGISIVFAITAARQPGSRLKREK